MLLAFKDLTAQRFGKLVVISRVAHVKGQRARWLCLCDCGTLTEVRSWNIASGGTSSCGCEQRRKLAARSTTHGRANSALYDTFYSIKGRSGNSANKRYKDYGGRGVCIYEKWENDFAAFERYILENLGERPKNKSLDRIDNDKGYEPGNLRWGTPQEQQSNKRNNVWLEYEGRMFTGAELARHLGVSWGTVRYGVKKGLYVVHNRIET